MNEIKHIGPIVERKILDSWKVNDYLVAIWYGRMGGLVVRLYEGADVIRSYPTDYSTNVILLFINSCLCAAARNAINTLPEKAFGISAGDAMKGLLYYETDRWEEYKSQFDRFDKIYIEELNEALMNANHKAVKQVNDLEIDEYVKMVKGKK